MQSSSGSPEKEETMLGLLSLVAGAASAALTATEIATGLIATGTVLCATQTIIDNVEDIFEE